MAAIDDSQGCTQRQLTWPHGQVPMVPDDCLGMPIVYCISLLSSSRHRSTKTKAPFSGGLVQLRAVAGSLVQSVAALCTGDLICRQACRATSARPGILARYLKASAYCRSTSARPAISICCPKDSSSRRRRRRSSALRSRPVHVRAYSRLMVPS